MAKTGSSAGGFPGKPQNRPSKRPPPPEATRFAPGQSGNPGGRPKSVREIEKMLDAEHRTVEEMRETYKVLRDVARGVDEPVFYQGAVCGYVRKYSAGHMELYLNRLQGPVKELKIDLTDAPEEVVAWLAEYLN